MQVYSSFWWKNDQFPLHIIITRPDAQFNEWDEPAYYVNLCKQKQICMS